ncbi:MAG: hypothetical protein PVF43_00895 [Candidatus Eiseniibacteriota bacterium]|jgi:hypothetical protein
MSRRASRWFLVPALGLAIAVIGCSKNGQESESSSTVTQLSQETNQELDHFRQEMQNRLDAMKQELDALHAQAQTLTGDAQNAANQKLERLDTQYQNMVDSMSGMHDAMMSRMQGMMGQGGGMMGHQKEAAGKVWYEMRNQMNQGMEVLNDGIDSAKRELMPGQTGGGEPSGQ